MHMAGESSGPVDHQVLQLFAHHLTPVEHRSIPNGEVRAVGGSDFDFTQPTILGPRLASTDPQIAAKKVSITTSQSMELPGRYVPQSASQILNPVGGWKFGTLSRACRSTAAIRYGRGWRLPKVMFHIVQSRSRHSIVRIRHIIRISRPPN